MAAFWNLPPVSPSRVSGFDKHTHSDWNFSLISGFYVGILVNAENKILWAKSVELDDLFKCAYALICEAAKDESQLLI